EQNEQLRSINDTKIRSTLFVYFVTHLPQPLAIFFFKDPATTQIYTLSLHDALPISVEPGWGTPSQPGAKGLPGEITLSGATVPRSEEHTLNSSHVAISYAVFCLKKKKERRLFTGRSSAP